MDAENVCATAGGDDLMMTALGSELMRGDQIMLTGTSVNLGRIRLAARRFHSQYLQHAAVAA